MVTVLRTQIVGACNKHDHNRERKNMSDEYENEKAGYLKFDARVGSVLSDQNLRNGIKLRFEAKVREITGLDKGNLKKLTKFLKNGVTYKPDNPHMPSNSELMRTSLNALNGYISIISAKCKELNQDQADPPIAKMNAAPATGDDFYCIDEYGRVFCYHSFELLSAEGDAVLVTNTPVKVPLVLTCSGTNYL